VLLGTIKAGSAEAVEEEKKNPLTIEEKQKLV